MAIIRTGNFAELGQIGTLKGVVAMQNASQAITRKGYAIIWAAVPVRKEAAIAAGSRHGRQGLGVVFSLA